MTQGVCLIVERSRDWQLIVGSDHAQLPSDAPIEELVNRLQAMIRSAGLKRIDAILAPASTSCFFATIRVDAGISASDRAALLYELEDHLPIDAESMVADFVALPPQPGGDQAFAAVAVAFERLRQIADALEAAGIPVRSIVPATVLAARALCRGSKPAETIDYLLVDESKCDVVTIRGETIVDWKHLDLSANRLQRFRLLRNADPDRTVVVGADAAQQAMVEAVLGACEFAEDPLQRHLLRGAERALASHSKQWLDLRRDQLGPSDPLRPIQPQLRRAAVAATACLLAVIAGGWWRTRRIESRIADVQSQQTQLFQAAFPGTPVPGALLRRIRSEHARVLGSRGASADVDVPQSAPDVLRELLASLPEDLRLRITSLDIADGEVQLDVQVRSPVDAGRLATSLAAAGFDVKPPVTTQQDTGTFRSVLEASWGRSRAGQPTPGAASAGVSSRPGSAR
jgi:type II secretion system protein L